MPPGQVLIIDKTRAKLRPLQNYAWTSFTYPLGTDKTDAAGVWFQGKWSVEIHNPDKAHVLHTNLT